MRKADLVFKTNDNLDGNAECGARSKYGFGRRFAFWRDGHSTLINRKQVALEKSFPCPRLRGRLMSVIQSLLFDEICRRGSVREADVRELRALYFGETPLLEVDANAIFEIDAACAVKDAEWQAFFVEAITDYVVDSAEPRGYINTANADWLIERITHDGQIETRTELEVLVHVIDKARWSPESLVKFTLNAVKDAVVSGSGAARGGMQGEAGVVTNEDVELIRRIIFAFGGDSHAAVSRAEAEVLFEINDLTAEKTDNAQWTELFVKAITGVVMAASGYRAPTRDVALRREQWLQSRGDLSLGQLVSAMFRSDGAGFMSMFDKESDEDRELARLERERREILTAEEVTGDEAAWLIAQIERDGLLTANEKCLLLHLKSQAPKLDPRLRALIDKVSDRVSDEA